MPPTELFKSQTEKQVSIDLLNILDSHGSESKHEAKPRLRRQARSPYIDSESIPLIRVVDNKTRTYCCDQWVVCCGSDNKSAALPVNNLCSVYKYRVLACGRRKATQSNPSRLLAAFLLPERWLCTLLTETTIAPTVWARARSGSIFGVVLVLKIMITSLDTVITKWFSLEANAFVAIVDEAGTWSKSGTYQRSLDGAQIGCGSDRQLGSLVPRNGRARFLEEKNQQHYEAGEWELDRVGTRVSCLEMLIIQKMFIPDWKELD